jgi:hypothetical protein
MKAFVYLPGRQRGQLAHQFLVRFLSGQGQATLLLGRDQGEGHSWAGPAKLADFLLHTVLEIKPPDPPGSDVSSPLKMVPLLIRDH